jgi:hypothetical protein
MKTVSFALLLGLATAGAAQARADEPPQRVRQAMKELWRRGFCLLSSVYKPAERQSALPRDLGRTPVLQPRVLGRRGALLCYAVDGETLWAADDQTLCQIDAAAGRLVRAFDRRAGLGDEPVQSLAAGAGAVWLATRSGLARLDLQAGRIAPVKDVRFALARLAAGPSGVWAVSDAGAWRLTPGQDRWQKLPDFPGRERLARTSRRGFWSAEWRTTLLSLLPAVAATDDGLYVLCLNRLLHYAPARGTWREVGSEVWQIQPQGRTLWALTTSGVLRYDAGSGKVETFASGRGPARGRPVALAATKRAFFLASRPDYDAKAGRFVGGGISRLDLAGGQWTVTEQVDGLDVRFVTAMTAGGDGVWAACTLFDRALQRGAHPGMAHVKRWRPHATGLGLLRFAAGRWTLLKRQGLKTERRWIMGQRGTVASGKIGPETVDLLRCCGQRVWGVYRMIPEKYYAGYYISAGCLAARSGERWQGRFDVRTDQFDLGGEQPELMLISHSHGHRIVLAEGHPIVLGIEGIAGRAWVLAESGVFRYDAAADRFAPVVREPMRTYWRVTAAAAGPRCLWFGGDGGTVSRFDRQTGRLECLGVAPGRKVTAIATAAGGIVVRTAATDAVLPVNMQSVPKLPNGEVLRFDGRRWSAGGGNAPSPASAFRCSGKGNYLYRGRERVAFLRGVFRPGVLCEDPAGGKLWLATYSGVASVPLPAADAK